MNQQLLGALLVFLCGGMALASDIEVSRASDHIREYRIRPCEYWRSIPNGYGFGCSIYPRMAYVPNSESVARAMDRLERRIEDLEHRVRELDPGENVGTPADPVDRSRP